MKRKILLLALTALVLLATSPALAQFVNGGFENGDFTGWTQGGGYWTGGWPINPTDYLPGGSKYNISGNRSAVVSPGLDPRTGNLLNMVYSGNYAARVNDYINDYTVSVISQSVKNWQDPHIYFAWAAVLEESHGATDSDNFILKLTDDTKGVTLYSVAYNSYTNGPLFTKTYWSGRNSYWFWTHWQVQDLDVSALQGDDFTLTLLGSDCPYGGHAGYVYLDGFGGVIPQPGIPVPPTVLLLGSGLAGLVGWRRLRKV